MEPINRLLVVIVFLSWLFKIFSLELPLMLSLLCLAIMLGTQYLFKYKFLTKHLIVITLIVGMQYLCKIGLFYEKKTPTEIFHVKLLQNYSNKQLLVKNLAAPYQIFKVSGKNPNCLGHFKIIGSFKSKSHFIIHNYFTINSIYLFFLKSRLSVRKMITTRLSQSAYNNLYNALLLGEKYEFCELYIKTGTIHLIVISGLHINLIFNLFRKTIFIVCRNLVPGVEIIKMITFLSWLLTLLYCSIINPGVSVIRSFFMLTLVTFARYFTNINAKDILGLAFIFILIVYPKYILTAGAWYSFTAVLILLECNTNEKEFYYIKKIKKYLVTQFWLQLGLLPISLYCFGFYPLTSIIVNSILLPIFSFIYFPTLLLSILIKNYLLIDIMSNYMHQFLSLFENSWLLDIYIGKTNACIMILIVLLVIKQRLNSILGLISYLVVITFVVLKINSKEYEIAFLNVGQGTSVIIRTMDHVVVYDTAFANNNFSFAKNVIFPYLKQRRINKIDKLIISHEDLDHSGGMDFLVENFKVKEIISSYPYQNMCMSGDSFNLDGVKFKFIAPTINDYIAHSAKANERSCVLLIDNAKHKTLLPGDIGSKQLQKVINKDTKDLSILLIPHHGSKNSINEKFIQHAKPKIGIMSHGRYNLYGHPHIETVNSYLNNNVNLFSTIHGNKVYLVSDEIKLK